MELKKDILQTLHKITYKANRILVGQGNHYLQGGTDRTFCREKLMYIPEDTQVPTDWVSKSK